MEDAAMAALEAYPWPGNVRELQNVLERACALAEDQTITRQDLPDTVLVPVAAAPGPLPSGRDPSGLMPGRTCG
jgi:transcriptional regulator of acetoin/glycerol metabolism